MLTRSSILYKFHTLPLPIARSLKVEDSNCFIIFFFIFFPRDRHRRAPQASATTANLINYASPPPALCCVFPPKTCLVGRKANGLLKIIRAPTLVGPPSWSGLGPAGAVCVTFIHFFFFMYSEYSPTLMRRTQLTVGLY